MLSIAAPARRRTSDRRLAAASLALTALTTARPGAHPRWEQRLFDGVNHPRPELAFLRVFQQLGTPWCLPAVAAAAAATGHRRLAVAAALSLPLEKLSEVGIKKARPTERPFYVRPTVLRDDAPLEGPSFPSGHAALAFALVTVLSPYLPPAAVAALAGAAAATSLTRIHQGAHHPVDSLGGAALGVAIGSGLSYAIGVGQNA
jgi:membrane-associated phospholipid phosphatase